MKAYCHLGYSEPIECEDVNGMLDHLRLMHPDEYGDGPNRWPDGSAVVVDETVEPGDFA